MKIIKSISILIIALVLATNCLAANITNGNIVYEYDNISIEFSADTQFNISEQEIIAEKIIYGSGEDEAGTYNIICTLVGHDLSTEYVRATEHKVDDLSPRCLEKIYEVVICSRCDYNTVELISEMYIPCCPEE